MLARSEVTGHDGGVGSVGVATWALVLSSVASLCSLLAVLTAVRSLRVIAREESRIQAAVVDLAAAVERAPQAWYWTAEWQAGEAEADEDIAVGRMTEAKSLDEMFDELDEVSARYAPTSG
jgi:hypothetical protein